MTEKEQLWYLIDGVISGTYDVKTFCTEFTRIYDLEVDYETLSEQENNEFADLSEMTGRYSDDVEELKIPHMFCDEKEIIDRVKVIQNKKHEFY